MAEPIMKQLLLIGTSLSNTKFHDKIPVESPLNAHSVGKLVIVGQNLTVGMMHVRDWGHI